MSPLRLKNWMFKHIIILSISLFVLMAAAVTAVIFTSKKQSVTQTHVPNKTFTVIIDAGHGGTDEGTKNKTIKEKDITLAIAKQIEALGPQYGLNVILTR